MAQPFKKVLRRKVLPPTDDALPSKCAKGSGKLHRPPEQGGNAEGDPVTRGASRTPALACTVPYHHLRKTFCHMRGDGHGARCWGHHTQEDLALGAEKLCDRWEQGHDGASSPKRPAPRAPGSPAVGIEERVPEPRAPKLLPLNTDKSRGFYKSLNHVANLRKKSPNESVRTSLSRKAFKIHNTKT